MCAVVMLAMVISKSVTCNPLKKCNLPLGYTSAGALGLHFSSCFKLSMFQAIHVSSYPCFKLSMFQAIHASCYPCSKSWLLSNRQQCTSTTPCVLTHSQSHGHMLQIRADKQKRVLGSNEYCTTHRLYPLCYRPLNLLDRKWISMQLVTECQLTKV